MTSQRITFAADGLVLEGSFSLSWPLEPGSGLIICHPHPLYGGDMENNVVLALDNAFAAVGFRVLRFNFRGVGSSQGSYAEGVGEQEDVKGALKWLAAQPSIDPRQIYLAGYSFGARVALYVAANEGRIRGFLAIAPPVLRGEWPSLDVYHGIKLFICGEADPYAPPEVLTTWVECLPEPKRLVILPNVDHFFLGHEHRLAQQAVELLQAFITSGER